MGSDMAEIRETEGEWKEALIHPDYQYAFRSWLLKEFPAHSVRVAPFAMMRFPVTNGAFRAFLEATGNATTPESIESGFPGNHPVWGVSLEEATRFGAWLSSETGRPWRLPAEEEWEFAARGGADARYPFGHAFDAGKCNTIESGRLATTAVGTFAQVASPFGIHDLAGNVEEWTAGRYAPYPGGTSIEDDLLKILGPGYPILRGGSFRLGGDLARTRRRHGPHPDPTFRITGFRLVHDL